MRWLWIGFLTLGLSGCASLPAAQDDGPKMVAVMVGIVNHTDKYVYSASVNGAGGGGMAEYGAGHASICCAMLPAKWYPGMKVNVRWDMPLGRQHVIKEREVEVERFDEPGSIFIHIFPENQVRVVISNHSGQSKKHPIPAPQKPAGWARKE